jgi:hypothetical protein
MSFAGTFFFLLGSLLHLIRQIWRRPPKKAKGSRQQNRQEATPKATGNRKKGWKKTRIADGGFGEAIGKRERREARGGSVSGKR